MCICLFHVNGTELHGDKSKADETDLTLIFYSRALLNYLADLFNKRISETRRNLQNPSYFTDVIWNQKYKEVEDARYPLTRLDGNAIIITFREM